MAEAEPQELLDSRGQLVGLGDARDLAALPDHLDVRMPSLAKRLEAVGLDR